MARSREIGKNRIAQHIHTGFFYFLVTNNSSPSLGIFATPARCFLWSENIAPPHKSEKEQRSLLFLDSRFCARYRILDLPSRVLFHLASLARKSLSNPVAREAVHELSYPKIISIIFVHDTGFGHSRGYFASGSTSSPSQNISLARPPLGLAASRTSSALGSNPVLC